jgi:hypothetical protein
MIECMLPTALKTMATAGVVDQPTIYFAEQA